MKYGSGKPYKRAGRSGYWLRVTFTDPVTGKRVEKVKGGFRTKAEARDGYQKLIREIEQTQGRSVAFEKATFTQLADHCESLYYKAAVYHGGRKVAGQRSYRSTKSRLIVLRAYFGERRLRGITYTDILKFKEERLATPTPRGVRSLTTVNRELEILRRMLNIAEREGWILKNPFSIGDRVISRADERRRERILSRSEESRLLAACDGQSRKHLKDILICALDTGMRQGEILKLKWSDVDFTNNTIVVRAFNTKTMTERQLRMTDRLRRIFERRHRDTANGGDELVFGITDNVKRSFASVRKEACLTEVRFHDLRHTAATRLVQGDLSIAEVGRILGHARPETTYRYLNADDTTLERAARILEAFSHEIHDASIPSAQVN